MRNTRLSTFSYFKNNFVRMALLTILPSIILAIVVSGNTPITFWKSILGGTPIDNVTSFMELYINCHTTINGDVNIMYLVGAIGVFTLCIAWSIAVFTTDRHMQLGIRINKDSIGIAMTLLARMTFFLVVILAVKELLAYVLVGIVYFCYILFDTMVVMIVSYVAYVFTVFSLAVVTAIFLSAMPAIASEDYPLNVAMSYSARLNSKRSSGFCIVFACIYTVLHLLVMAIVSFVNTRAIVVAIYFVYYWGWAMYLPVLACNRYIKNANIQRKDVVAWYNRGAR